MAVSGDDVHRSRRKQAGVSGLNALVVRAEGLDHVQGVGLRS